MKNKSRKRFIQNLKWIILILMAETSIHKYPKNIFFFCLLKQRFSKKKKICAYMFPQHIFFSTHFKNG